MDRSKRRRKFAGQKAPLPFPVRIDHAEHVVSGVDAAGDRGAQSMGWNVTGRINVA